MWPAARPLHSPVRSCHAPGMERDRPDGSSDDERWAQALSILGDQPTHRASEHLRRRRRLALATGIGVVVAGVAAGVLGFALASGDAGSDSADPPVWQELTGLTVQGVGMVIEVYGLVVMLRAGLLRKNRWTVPAAVLTREQRKSLLDQVRGRAAVDPGRLALVRDTARQMLRQRGLLALFVGILLIQIGGALSSPELWRTLMAGAFVVLYGWLFWVLERNARKAERFLATHAEPAQAG